MNETEQPGQTQGRHTSVPFAPLRGGEGRVRSVCELSLFRDAGGSERGCLPRRLGGVRERHMSLQKLPLKAKVAIRCQVYCSIRVVRGELWQPESGKSPPEALCTEGR